VLRRYKFLVVNINHYTPAPRRGRGVYCFTSVRPSSVQEIFPRIFLSNYWWTHQISTSCLATLLIFIHIEHICSFFVAFFSATIDGRNLIFGHKLHIVTPYRGKRFWTHQIPTSCLPILLIFIHIEHICTFFSATIDDRNLIFGHKLHIGMPYCGKRFWTCQIPTSCLPKSGGIIGEH
jgi:hypothetical protein